MTEYQGISPGVVGIKTTSKTESEIVEITMKSMLDLISSTKRIFLRRPITTEMNTEFETATVKYLTTVRFQVIDGEPGIQVAYK